MWDVMDGAVVPYELKQSEDGKWVASCKFCPEEFTANHAEFATGFAKDHAQNLVDGHYDSMTGLYYSPERLKLIRDERAEHRRILGSREDTQNLNASGL